MNAKTTIISVISLVCVNTIGSLQVSDSPISTPVYLSSTGGNPILVELQERGSGRRESKSNPTNIDTYLLS